MTKTDSLQTCAISSSFSTILSSNGRAAINCIGAFHRVKGLHLSQNAPLFIRTNKSSRQEKWLALVLFSLCLIAFFPKASAQHLYLPVALEQRVIAERMALHDTSQRVHGAIQAFARGEFGDDRFAQLTFADSLDLRQKKKFWHWLDRKVFNEHFIQLKGDDYEVNLDPWINTEVGIDPGIANGSSITYLSTRGIWMEGRIGKDFTFFTGFAENLGAFPDYLMNYYDRTGYVLGRGNYNNDRGGSNIDFPIAVGGVSYQPSKYFNITFGQGKNFIGEGYRSVFLSDFALPYPYLRIETKLGLVNYMNLWAIHTDPRQSVETPGGLYRKKYTSIHYLSWNATDRLNIALFESMVWGGDSTQPNSGFYVNFLNPVIFFRPVEKLVGVTGGNAMLGLAASYRIADGMRIYGQFALDDFQFDALQQLSAGHWLNMYAWQLGWKYHRELQKDEHIFGRFEYNGARPFMYAHRTATSNYTHLMHPLAHPWGSNFQEFVLQAQWQNKRWVYDLQINFGFRGRDTSDVNYGNDLFRSIFDREAITGFHMGSPAREYLLYAHAQVGWIVNIITGSRVEAGIRMRNVYGDLIAGRSANSTWLFAGYRMPLFTRYFDH